MCITESAGIMCLMLVLHGQFPNKKTVVARVARAAVTTIYTFDKSTLVSCSQ